jgi:hypothetical protein
MGEGGRINQNKNIFLKKQLPAFYLFIARFFLIVSFALDFFNFIFQR